MSSSWGCLTFVPAVGWGLADGLAGYRRNGDSNQASSHLTAEVEQGGVIFNIQTGPSQWQRRRADG